MNGKPSHTYMSWYWVKMGNYSPIHLFFSICWIMWIHKITSVGSDPKNAMDLLHKKAQLDHKNKATAVFFRDQMPHLIKPLSYAL